MTFAWTRRRGARARRARASHMETPHNQYEQYYRALRHHHIVLSYSKQRSRIAPSMFFPWRAVEKETGVGDGLFFEFFRMTTRVFSEKLLFECRTYRVTTRQT